MSRRCFFCEGLVWPSGGGVHEAQCPELRVPLDAMTVLLATTTLERRR